MDNSETPRETVDGWEYIFDGKIWVGFADPWTPTFITVAEMSAIRLARAAKNHG